MNTTITELNTINHYRSAFNVIRDFFPEELDKLTDDQRAELDSFDDYEDFGYTVINYDTMVMDTDGHVVSIESLQDFLQHTLDYLREGDEPDDVNRGPVIGSIDDLLKYTGTANVTKLADLVGSIAECCVSIDADEKAVTVTGFLTELPDDELSNSFFFPFHAFEFDSWIDELKIELALAYQEHFC